MNKQMLAALGTVLQKRRSNLNFSIAEMAELANVEQAWIVQLENASADDCSIGHLLQLAHALNVPPSMLLGEAEMLVKGSQK